MIWWTCTLVRRQRLEQRQAKLRRESKANAYFTLYALATVTTTSLSLRRHYLTSGLRLWQRRRLPRQPFGQRPHCVNQCVLLLKFQGLLGHDHHHIWSRISLRCITLSEWNQHDEACITFNTCRIPKSRGSWNSKHGRQQTLLIN